MTETAIADALARARSYPYDVPRASYVLFQGEAVSLKRMNPPDDTPERIPLLAYGSNASPTQLRRKFPDLGPEQAIPVLKTALTGFDVVYSARFSSYGAIPAMLAPSAGTRLTTFVVWLTEAQLETMHDTELGPGRDGSAYTFGRLGGILAMIDAIGLREELFMYRSAAPALVRDDGAMRAYAEIEARERTVAAVRHDTMLKAVHEDLAPERTYEDFVLQVAHDADARAAYAARLKETGVPVRLKGYKKVLPA